MTQRDAANPPEGLFDQVRDTYRGNIPFIPPDASNVLVIDNNQSALFQPRNNPAQAAVLTVDQPKRMIHVNESVDYTTELPFQSVKYYASNGFQQLAGTYPGTKVLDGVTEYLTRSLPRPSGRPGQNEEGYKVAKAVVNQLGPDGPGVLASAYFAGNPTNLKRVDEALKKVTVSAT
jgi:hypothetical protein